MEINAIVFIGKMEKYKRLWINVTLSRYARFARWFHAKTPRAKAQRIQEKERG